MTIQEAKSVYIAIKEELNNPDGLLDLVSNNSIIRQHAQNDSDLNRFFGLDEDGPYSEFLKFGLKSLRLGFYKIDSQPYLNKSINPSTFAAEVLYFHPLNSKVIKYNCNIGPMVNMHKIYKPELGSFNKLEQIPVLESFEKDILIDKTNYGYFPKLNFFNFLFSSSKVFFVREAIYDPNYPMPPRPKRITWSFIDY